ncbi:hypothetical protein OTUT144_2042 [Orientia tsutsugamushi str. UT144]|uniref:Uncharacterized protein n=1 Tax=Orientia tsutsugamushi str. UT144 TaxID=1441384 RepID=A0A0F3RHK1_ORITS|nr:hypothetical protein [Orientia tsutsugamushi]KJW05920.1 hypothetical protein OTUT144_2042 [Orientia tsutsugamushi str. UT144]
MKIVLIKKIFIKAKTEFEDSYIRENYLKDLESAFKTQDTVIRINQK